MTEVWRNIFKQYVKCYVAIQTLYEHGIFDEEERAAHEHNLLHEIIETMRSEVND